MFALRLQRLLLTYDDEEGDESAAVLKYGDVDSPGGTVRIEIVRNHNNGKCSYVGGLKLLVALEEQDAIDTTEEQRKDAIGKSSPSSCAHCHNRFVCVAP